MGSKARVRLSGRQPAGANFSVKVRLTWSAYIHDFVLVRNCVNSKSKKMESKDELKCVPINLFPVI